MRANRAMEWKVEKRVAQAVEAEREACAQLADDHYDIEHTDTSQICSESPFCGQWIAAAIRARGK